MNKFGIKLVSFHLQQREMLLRVKFARPTRKLFVGEDFICRKEKLGYEEICLPQSKIAH